MSECLAVDPGRRAGWAVWFEERIARSGIVAGDELDQVAGVVRKYRSLGTMVLEDQFISTHINSKGRRQPRNQKGIKTLLYRRHLWEITARTLGMEIVTVNPSTWQSFYRLRRGDKDSIVKLARMLTGRDVEKDEADAVLMARWWAQRKQALKAIGGVK